MRTCASRASRAAVSPSTARAASQPRSTGAPSISVLLEIASGGPDVTVMPSPHQPPPEPHGDCLGPVGRTELAEQPARVGLHRVLGQVELLADLGVAATATHAAKHLQLAFGERRDAL